MRLSQIAHKPKTRTFHYADGGMGGLDRVDDEKESVFSLDLEYADKKSLDDLRDKCLKRVPASAKGMKALVESEEKYRELLVKRVLHGWRMTKAGLMALQAEIDFTKLKDDEEIVFNEENVVFLVNRSRLAQEIQLTLGDFAAWYGIDEGHPDPASKDEDEGNSGSGQKLSSDASEVAPAASATT